MTQTLETLQLWLTLSVEHAKALGYENPKIVDDMAYILLGRSGSTLSSGFLENLDDEHILGKIVERVPVLESYVVAPDYEVIRLAQAIVVRPAGSATDGD